MGSSSEKFQLVFEARDAASAKIRQLNRELARLGGPKMVKSRREIKKLERSIQSLSKVAPKAGMHIGKMAMSMAKGMLIAQGVTLAITAITGAIKQMGEAVLVAAKVEELGKVLQFVGQHAGYSKDQIDSYAVSLRKSGIAQKETYQSMLRAIQGNIDLADALKLGRIAQDAAVIGQTNSSEAFQTLINAVVKGRVVLLKSLGIQGTFQREYKNLAVTLGKTQVELTEVEKQQARLNLVIKGGVIIAGAYETAMTTASKQLRTYDRLSQDLQISIGKFLVPTFGVLIRELSTTTKIMTAAFSDNSNNQVRDISVSIAKMAAGLVMSAKVMFNLGQLSYDVFDLAFIAPIKSIITLAKAMATALANPWDLDAWAEAGDLLSGVFDGFGDALSSTAQNIKDIENAVLSYEATVSRVIATAFISDEEDPMIAVNARLSKQLTAMTEAALETKDVFVDVEEAAYDMVGNSSNRMAVLATYAQQAIAATGRNLQWSMQDSVSNMINSLNFLQTSSNGVFKNMASDFIQLFIKTAMMQLALKFVGNIAGGGILGVLSSLFDTPKNDRMAAGEGRSFMSWFTKGMLAEAQGGSEMAVGITNSSRSIAPVTSGGGGGGGGGMVVLNVSVSGNVLSSDYVEQTIAPQLEKLINDGRSLLSVQDENQTGGRDVVIN